MKPPVHILGAGFSGLVTAWALTRRGFNVEVHEKLSRPGGLIATPTHKFGSYETAANGLLNTALIEELFSDLDLEIFQPMATAKRKYIYRSGPKRWPLSAMETTGLLGRWLLSKSTGQAYPRPHETLEQWGVRVVGVPTTRHLLGPAIQGVYAGDPSRLSATLLLGRLLKREKLPRPKVTGSIFPKNGMQQLIERLIEKVEARGGRVHYQSTLTLAEARREGPSVLATSAPAAAVELSEVAPEAARRLATIEMLPLAVVQLYLPPTDRPLAGFGCLFPKDSGFHSLGVLFEHFLYPHRLQGSAERWILGGTRNPRINELSDGELVAQVTGDHQRLGGAQQIVSTTVTRWPVALPHYTVELERVLAEIQLPDDIFLIGNYLGRIGLGQILAKANELAQHMAEKYEA